MAEMTVFLPLSVHSIDDLGDDELALIRHRIVESMDWDDVDFAAGDPPYNLSVCTVMTSDWYIDARSNRTVSGAADRVVEWIEFHLEVGFEHFVIFDNSHSRCGEGECSALHDVLRQYISAHSVTYIYWPTPLCDVWFEGLSAWRRWGPQIAAFNSCIGRFGATTKWMALHDVDEFLAPIHSRFESVQQILDDVERRMDLDDAANGGGPNGRSSFEAVNSIGFVQRLLMNCTDLKDVDRGEYEHRSKMVSLWSRYQCMFRTLEPKNKKLLIRPLRTRSILIHFPTYFYPGFVAEEYLLNATTEAVMFHARSNTVFAKNDYYVLPPDHNLLYWLDRLHSRLATQRLSGH